MNSPLEVVQAVGAKAYRIPCQQGPPCLKMRIQYWV